MKILNIPKWANHIFGVDNERIVNLRSVQWARLHYVNQYGQEVSRVPTLPTYRLQMMSKVEITLGADGQAAESRYEKALRLGLLDEWYPVLYLQLTANHRLKYSGEKAQSIFEAWKAKQFSKKKEK